MAHWRRTVLRWVLLGVLAALIGVPVGLWLWLNARYGGELEAELDKLRAAGAPLTAAAAMPPPVPANQNAAPLYLKVFQLGPDPTTWHKAPAPPVLDRLSAVQDMARDTHAPNWPQQLRAAYSTPDARGVLAELRAASERPFCVFGDLPNPRGPWPGYYHDFRLASRVLAARALLSDSDGDTRGALDWLAVGYRLADHASQSPALMGQLVADVVVAITDRAAQECLWDAALDRASVSELTRALERCRLGDGFSRSMAMARATGLAMLDDVRASPAEYAPLLGGQQARFALHDLWARLGWGPRDDWGPLDQYDPTPVVGALLTGAVRSGVAEPTLRLEGLNRLRHDNRVVEWSRVPYRLLVGRWREPTDAFRPGTVMLWYAPLFVLAAAKRDTYQARVDLLRTVLMLKVHRHEHGSYPASLAVLGPKRPTDVFSGKDFIYRRQGQGFLLYSVGQNLQDDGGHEVRPDPTQGDIVWECAK
jgi:hypothetical protein